MGCPHTNFTRGQRVLIRLKPEGTMIGKFIERRRASVDIERNDGRIAYVATSIIKSVSIYKPRKHSNNRR